MAVGGRITESKVKTSPWAGLTSMAFSEVYSRVIECSPWGNS